MVGSEVGQGLRFSHKQINSTPVEIQLGIVLVVQSVERRSVEREGIVALATLSRRTLHLKH